ncbi:uncharacterized protein [Solanum tuberosum]|uniref:uncharacterized protein n=1 Tax=Solanum tuberosum TaxID=4113 RepID=UPI00073A0E51|nr:PREDICTED: uncharacterized protein LOC107063325 [Solanum tuberosum]
MNHVGIEAVACDFNGNRALSSLDTEGCCEERMLRLGSLPKITSTNKRRYPNKEPNNHIGGCLLEVEYVQDESLGTIFNVDKSTSEELTSYSSTTLENHGLFLLSASFFNTKQLNILLLVIIGLSKKKESKELGKQLFVNYKATEYFWQWTIFALPICDLCVHGAKYEQW